MSKLVTQQTIISRASRACLATAVSRVSEKTWQTALKLLALQPESVLFVLHVTQASKSYLPQHLTATHIQHEYTTAFIKHKLSKAGALSHASCTL